jgi:hypothetical protein
MAAPLIFAGWRVLGASVVGTSHRGPTGKMLTPAFPHAA